VRCGACGADNPTGKRFCGDCATPLSAACPACGSVTEPGRRFCGDCGAPLPAAEAPIAAGTAINPEPVPVAERRVCSVLFCDLVGFTPLSESRDPEEVRELLSRYFDAARTVIGRYGGVVEKFIGDAVMAVWGTPLAAEGDAERAVRAALDVVSAVAQLGVETGLAGLSARAGVVTGEVAVTLGATHEGMVAGDAVNTAARVQSVASAGVVLVDGTTRRLASSAIGFDDAGEHTLKGKAEPEQLWRATRVLSNVGGAQRVDGLEAPMTGRDAELRLVKELFHASSERRVPRLVAVTGPAGIGKTRLGWEFEKYIDGLADTMFWHRGRCLSYGDGVSFWALAEIVRQRLGIAEEESPDVAASKLADGIARFVPDPAEQAYIGARLARLLGVTFGNGSGAALGRPELFAGWRMFFERLAEVQPVVLLVEDSQYADDGLLDFFDHLVDWSRDLPIFVLVFGRPELEQGRPGFGTGRNRTALTLDPLDAASMDVLLDALVPGMPVAARQAISDRAQGIPLFAVETVRSLIDRDVVQPIEGVYRLVGDVGELAVPDSLHALLAARLDSLDPDVRRLVADAAVLGSTFPAEALIAVSGRPEEPVRSALADLLRREVLEVSADPLSPERGAYRFAQEMLRQVAYETLSRRDRKTRHLAVAAHLRATFPSDGEEVADVIARHYLDALAAVPDDPDIAAIRDDAIGELIRSAERAERTGAPARATVSYAAAAGFVEESAAAGSELAAAGLWEHAATAAVTTGDWESVLVNAEKARIIYTAHADPRGAARAQTAAGEALRRAGRHSEAREQLTAAVEVLRTNPDSDTVRALDQLGALETFAGRDADQLTSEGLTLAQTIGVSADVLAGSFITRGIWLAFNARRPESCAYHREAARLAERVGNTVVAGRALLNLADGVGDDDRAAAIDAARTAAGYLRRTGDRDGLSFALTNLATALVATGDWGAARDVLVHGLEVDGLEESGYVAAFRVWMAALGGDAGLAESVDWQRAELQASEDPQDRGVVTMVGAFVATARRDPAEALRLANVTLSYADAVGIGADAPQWTWPLAARSAHELGDSAAVTKLLDLLDAHRPGEISGIQRAERALVRVRLASGQADPAVTASFAAAIESLRALSTPYHVAHGLLDYGEHLIACGDAAAATLAVAEAREIALRLGAQLVLDRADGITAQLQVSA
jgi:class 3 adenylate cyclase/tetratricopeptide (TPR) repeat protein